MIGRIQGKLLSKQAPEVLVDVNGVGYELQVPMSTVYGLPEAGEGVTLVTHLAVREDAHVLYGFATGAERSLFRALIKVNGVGPKLALAILSSMDVEAFVRCVREGNSAALVRMPGVGKKTAERLLVEMRDRLQAWRLSEDSAPAPSSGTGAGNDAGPAQEAEAALLALGYKPQQAAKAVASAARAGAVGSEALIRQALKNMV